MKFLSKYLQQFYQYLKKMRKEKKFFSLDSSSTGYFGSRREGGISNVPIIALKFYLHFVIEARERVQDKEWLPSIREFSDMINGDPVLRMNWEYGFHQCKETLQGRTGDDILNMMDTVCKRPPSFSHNALVGFPINALFVEFMQNQNGRTFFSHERVNQALKKILNDYGKMLLTPFSTKYLTAESEYGWFSSEAEKYIHNEWYKCDPNEPNYGYKCWNDWFLREFKDGMRPIGQGTPVGIKEENVIVNSCESAPLSKPTQPQRNVQFQDRFWLKDNLYSLNDMFGGKKHNKEYIAENFAGGTVYQAFLSALFYHRWHSPVDGVIEDIYDIDGTYYLDQSQFIPYDSGSPNDSESFLSAVAARKVVLIKANNPKIGKVGIIYIGMAEVSSCVHTVEIGQKVKKGEQLGYFMFGGSSHVMVFEKKAKLIFREEAFYQFNTATQDFESLKQNLHSYLAHILE